ADVLDRRVAYEDTAEHLHGEYRKLRRLPSALQQRIERTVTNGDLQARDNGRIDAQSHARDANLTTALVDGFRRERRIEDRAVARHAEHEITARFRVRDGCDVGR